MDCVFLYCLKSHLRTEFPPFQSMYLFQILTELKYIVCFIISDLVICFSIFVNLKLIHLKSSEIRWQTSMKCCFLGILYGNMHWRNAAVLTEGTGSYMCPSGSRASWKEGAGQVTRAETLSFYSFFLTKQWEFSTSSP